jgi:nucleoside-diphosphate-sugar epimerase
VKALVIGGTGPTGPYVVNGLLERGYKVTIMHGGFHEVEFAEPVEHLHGDPHFKETLEETLGNRSFDLIIFTYGRLRFVVEAAKERTGRFIAVGGITGGAAKRDDPKWGELGPHLNISEATTVLENNINSNKFGYLMAASELAVLNAHDEKRFCTSYLGYPLIYGPRQPGPIDWCIVRRIIDGRRQFIIADGGLKIFAAAYAENAAHALLLIVDQPDISGGKKYFMTDQKTYTIRQRIEFIAKYMDYDLELIDMPFDLATPCHILWRRERTHYFRDTNKIQSELGYKDLVPPDRALEKTVDWLLENRPKPGSEMEIQLGDPFDYVKEDKIIDAWKRFRSEIPQIRYPLPQHAHIYRHPKKPNEAWRPL